MALAHESIFHCARYITSQARYVERPA